MTDKAYKTYKLVTDKSGKRCFVDKESGKPLHKQKPVLDLGSISEKAKKIISGAKEAIDLIRTDIESIRRRDPAAKSNIEVLALYSGMHAVLAYRVAHKLYVTNHFLSARAISQIARWITGIEIHPGATIGRGLFIDHGMGVVIGETTVIGDDCTIYQGVTLGGTGKDTGKRHPTLGNNIMIGAGAKVLGPLTVGDYSKVAAGAVVLSNIPEHSTAVGVPAKVVRQRGERIDEDVDQIHIPDPTSRQICELEVKLTRLQKELDKLKKDKNVSCESCGNDTKNNEKETDK